MLFGRWEIARKPPLLSSKSQINKMISKPALIIEKSKIFCQRCGQKTSKKRASLPKEKYYCPQCLNFGRITSLDTLYTISEPNFFSVPEMILTWLGELSPYQQKSAQHLMKVVNNNETFLLWAVTGAGKTEILFPALAHALEQKKRVCIASPRIDVCNELYPRLKAAFSQITITLLHGQQKQKYQYTQLVICTTHQLVRFNAAFDILIIDEVDAFPFRNDHLLEFAVKTARKRKSALIMLTATPTKKLLQKAGKGVFSFDYLPLRYHGAPLPQPQVFCETWKKNIQQEKISIRLKRIFADWEKQGYPFLIFVPRINLLKPIFRIVRQNLKEDIKGTTVHASDEHRIEKIEKMRSGYFRYLVTTTILERGVTFPFLNVLVLGADDEIFTRAVLVQIAGRVGRNKKRPTGDVFFICEMQNKEVKEACRQIAFVNRKGAVLKNETMSSLPKKNS